MGKSLNIAQKIWLSLGIIIAGYFASVGIAFILGKGWESRLYNVSENLYTASVQCQAALTSFNDQVKVYNEIVIIGNMGNLIETAHEKAGNVQTALKNIAQLKKLDAKQLDEIKNLLAILEAFNKDALSVYIKAGEDSGFVFEDSEDTENSLEDEIFRIGQETNVLREKLFVLSKNFSDKLKGELADISRDTRHYRYLNLLLFMGIVCVAGIAVWFVISRSIIRPLRKIINNLTEYSGEVVASSVNGVEISSSLADRSFQQAASIEEVSASLEEMSSMTSLNADHAEKTRDIVTNVLILIQKTDAFMTDLMASMTEITSASRETSNIVKTIDEIAFQTNLLSLNAAVEAARAGETGAGFAVVANEVRNLALRSAKAAKNTSELIEGNVKKIEIGEHITKDTIQTFKSVAQGAEDIRKLINEVASASDNQAQGIDQVNKAITEMDQVTQQNAGTAEQAAAASRQMKERTKQMKIMVDSLTAMIEGLEYDPEKNNNRNPVKIAQESQV